MDRRSKLRKRRKKATNLNLYAKTALAEHLKIKQKTKTNQFIFKETLPDAKPKCSWKSAVYS
jgi:hypothetical protein